MKDEFTLKLQKQNAIMSTLVTIRQTTTTTTTTMNTNNGDNNNNIESQTPVRSYGITGPISTKGPDPSDRIATESLEETLRSYDYFESDAELAHRVDVMAKLNALVKKWIHDVSLAKNLPPETVDTVGGRVHTFGSYRLGVHSKGKKKRKQLEKITSINSISQCFKFFHVETIVYFLIKHCRFFPIQLIT